MHCRICRKEALGLVTLRLYTREGVEVCQPCYELIRQNEHKPYSKVMDRLAVVEAGYHVNRKLARR